MKLTDKYLTEGDSPLTFTHTLFDDQITEFLKLLKMETPPSFNSDYKKIYKQSVLFKRSLKDFVKKIT